MRIKQSHQSAVTLLYFINAQAPPAPSVFYNLFLCAFHPLWLSLPHFQQYENNISHCTTVKPKDVKLPVVKVKQKLIGTKRVHVRESTLQESVDNIRLLFTLLMKGKNNHHIKEGTHIRG